MNEQEFIRRMKDEATFEHMHEVFWVQPDDYHRLIQIADEKVRLEAENKELRKSSKISREGIPYPLQALDKGVKKDE